jgi:uncharacterized protein
MEIKTLSGLKMYQMTLGPGDGLHAALRDFLEKEHLRKAFVLTCIGSCSRVVAVYPKTHDIPPELGRLEWEGLFEINGISGDVTRDGDEIRVHLHGSVTSKGNEVFGGAIQEGTTIFKMADLVIAGLD